jgi:hypothetical protein
VTMGEFVILFVVAVVSGLVVAIWSSRGPISKVKWIAATVMIVGGVALVWVIIQRSASARDTVIQTDTSDTQGSISPPLKKESPVDSSGAGGSVPTPPFSSGRRSPPPPQPQRLSQNVVLRDGDQETILDGKASIGADFTRIGEMDVPTLHVHTQGDDVKNYPILDASFSVEVEVGGRRYTLAAAKDLQARMVTVHIEEER